MLGVSANTTMCRPAATGRRNEIESTSDLANERIAQTRVDDSTPHESGNLPGDSCALCDEAASNRAKQILWITEHYFSRGWVELGALRELMKSSPRLKARYEALVTRDSEAQSVMKEPLRALCRVTKLPLSEAIDWVTNNPSGALQGRRLTFSQQRALLELMAKPPVEQTLGMFAKAGVLDPSVKVVRLSGQVASGASYDFELLLSPAFLRAWDEPCESLVERMNAGSFRDLIVDHYLRCAEPGISNPRSNPLVLMLCAVPRLFPSGVERRRWIGLRGADLGDGRGEFGFGFLDGAPLLDCLKRDEILAKWLEHGSFPESGRTDGEPEWVDLVNYRYSRIEGGANSLIRTGRDYSHVLRVGGSESFDFETREPWTDIRASGTEISVSEQELEEEMQKTGMGAKECVLGMLRTRGFVGIDADSCTELPRAYCFYRIRLNEIPQA